MKTSKCKKHGVFTEEEAYVYSNPKYKDGKLLRCKKCCANGNIKRYKKNTATHCYRHGDLNEDNAYKAIEEGRIRFRCKICAHENSKKRYKENREEAILRAAKWKRENKERVRELNRIDREKNPEKYKKWREDYEKRNRDHLRSQGKEFRERHKDRLQKKAVCKLHNIEISDYEEMVKDQENKCKICGMEETRIWKGKPMRLCIDHDHKTGKIRGLLCHSCNTGLGKFCDNTDLLERAIMYLMDNE